MKLLLRGPLGLTKCWNLPRKANGRRNVYGLPVPDVEWLEQELLRATEFQSELLVLAVLVHDPMKQVPIEMIANKS